MKLFEEIKLNHLIQLKNRMVMAPLTRCFANSNGCITNQIVEYYLKRSDFGLIVTEATNISKRAVGYKNTPGLYTSEQVKAWKKLTTEMKKRDSKIFVQLWHVGRVSHPFFLEGLSPLAPSAVQLVGQIKREKKLSYALPKAMTLEEINQTINDYKLASERAIDAGFDGVEIHAANGYLIDQFLHQETNQRKDIYGVSIEGRSLFLINTIKAITSSIGEERIGVRLSPAAHLFINNQNGDDETFSYLLNRLNNDSLAYVHNGHFNDFQNYDYLNGRASEFIRKIFKGHFINCGSYTTELAEEELNLRKFDMIAFGRLTIANPDLVSKIKNKQTLVDYDSSLLSKLN